MDLELEGKRAIVTGGSLGIGKAIAFELAREGVDVAIAARRLNLLEEAAAEIAAATGRKILPVPTDTSDRESVERMGNVVASEFGGIDILVNSAGFVGGMVRGIITEADEDDLIEDIGTKLFGYFRCAKVAAQHMRRQGWGRIINIGGLSGRSSGNLSGMRNAGVAHLTKTLSDQLGQFGINVNCIHPGATITERSAPMYEEQAKQAGTTPEAVMEGVARNIAIRRIVEARELAYFATFLASPRSVAVTGEIIAAGGGSVGTFFQ